MSSDVPIGTVIMWAGQLGSLPIQWLLCDGSLKSQARFAELYKVIGTSFGGSPPAGEFYLPNLQGRFVRGVDASTKFDPDAANRVDGVTGDVVGGKVGSYQPDAVQQHTHNYEMFPNGRGGIAAGQYWDVGMSKTGGVNDARVSTETRPANVALFYVIKAE